MYTGLPRSCKNPNVNVIGHSGSEYFKYDYERVIPQLAKEGKLIEINDSAFRYKRVAPQIVRRLQNFVKIQSKNLREYRFALYPYPWQRHRNSENA